MSTPYIPGPLVEELDDNPVVIARDARKALGPHTYNSNPDPATGKRIGYQRATYEHQEFPKSLYHKDWGLKPKPNVVQFTKGIGADGIEAAQQAYDRALKTWERGNRVKTVHSKKEEDRLLKIGWLSRPPVIQGDPEFDANSDEL